MSGDEVFATIVSVIITLVAWGIWYSQAFAVHNWSGKDRSRRPLLAAPLLAAIGIYTVLQTIASYDVVDDPRYIFMYLVMGLAWVGVMIRLTPLFGINYRLDALERHNEAAGVSIGGAVIAIGACYAGGNVGSGPGWWVVVVCAFLATASLLCVWLVFELATKASESVCIERDYASGLRLMGLLISAGLIFGRSVAGDWHSMNATIEDFATTAWPVLGVLALAIGLELLYRPPARRHGNSILIGGIIPAASYICVAVFYILITIQPAERI